MPGTSLGFRSVEGKENLADPAPTVSLAFCENTFRAKSARRGEEISQSIGNARDIIGFRYQASIAGDEFGKRANVGRHHRLSETHREEKRPALVDVPIREAEHGASAQTHSHPLIRDQSCVQQNV